MGRRGWAGRAIIAISRPTLEDVGVGQVVLADVGHPLHLLLGEGDVVRLAGQAGVEPGAGVAFPIWLHGGVVAGVAEFEAAGLEGEGLEGVVGGDVPPHGWVGGGPGGGVPDGKLAGRGRVGHVSNPSRKAPLGFWNLTQGCTCEKGWGGVLTWACMGFWM